MVSCCQGDQQYWRVSEGTRCQLWVRKVSNLIPFNTGSTPSLLVSAGSFKRPLFADDGTTCIGIETVDGTEYHADKVVLAAGAWSSTLVDLEDQCVSKVS
jgi:tRNA U34 5-carboxymethylaminomethyl modifying enzyme MnmG/GidA